MPPLRGHHQLLAISRDELRYITVYRHPIDVHFSFRKHTANMKKDIDAPSVPTDPSESFRQYLENEDDHASFFSIIDHYRCTLKHRHRENVLSLHYRDMLRDLGGTFDQIATHTGLNHPPDIMSKLVEAATFASMKSNAVRFAPSAGQDFWRNDAGFFDSASSNKWEGLLTDSDLAAYDKRISELLTPSERNWLEWGSVAK